MAGIKTDTLSIGYHPDRPLIRDLSFSLEKGQVIGLIGQNGVGKSTLLRSLCGLQEPLNGSILIEDQNIKALSNTEIAKKISIVMTGRPEGMNQSVIELLALGRIPYTGWLGLLQKPDKEIIENALNQLQINYIATKKLYELSDGQLQKVMIARALTQNTDYIFLDEPTSHLDLRNKIETLQLLRELSDTGKGILISSHEISLASQYCDRFLAVDFNKECVMEKPTKMIDTGIVEEYLHLPKTSKL